MRPSMFLTVSVVLALSCCASTAADAAKLSRVYIKDGDFYAGNERLRLWGFSAGAGMMLSDQQQTKVVARLKFLGVNCLRLIGLGATRAGASRTVEILDECKRNLETV